MDRAPELSPPAPRGTPVYLDCNASTPLDPAVRACMQDVWAQAGNASSTHQHGARQRAHVERAAVLVARLLGFGPADVVWLSGATEANALAIRGVLGQHAGGHVLTSPLEHPAVRVELAAAQRRGFTVETLPLDAERRVCAARLARALRVDTRLVCTTAAHHVTSIAQPLGALSDSLAGHPAHWHVDAAQWAGKRAAAFERRIDSLSVSAHKMYGPQGIGALLVRPAARAGLVPLLPGGGQQGGLRGGTLPVALIAGLGMAAACAMQGAAARHAANAAYGATVMSALDAVGAVQIGPDAHRLAHGLTVVLPGVESVDALAALAPHLSASAGSACSAGHFREDPGLTAMGLDVRAQACLLRLSWCHTSPAVDWAAATAALAALVATPGAA